MRRPHGGDLWSGTQRRDGDGCPYARRCPWGAGEQLVERLHRLVDGGQESDLGADHTHLTDINKFILGSPQFHKPRTACPRLMELVREARDNGVVSGKYMELAMAIERHLAETKGKPVPMNIDGATAVIFAELGFAPPLARGLFCLSRSVGAMAHGYEQMQQGGRNKGPTPPHYRWSYTGKD